MGRVYFRTELLRLRGGHSSGDRPRAPEVESESIEEQERVPESEKVQEQETPALVGARRGKSAGVLAIQARGGGLRKGARTAAKVQGADLRVSTR